MAKAYTDKLNSKIKGKDKEEKPKEPEKSEPKAALKYSDKEIDEFADILLKLVPQEGSMEVPISSDFGEEELKKLAEVAKKKGFNVVKTDGGKMKVSKI